MSSQSDLTFSSYEQVLESIIDEAYEGMTDEQSVWDASIEIDEDKKAQTAIGLAVIRAMGADNHLRRTVLGSLLRRAFRIARNTAFEDGSLLFHDDWRKMEQEIETRISEGRF